MNTVLESFGLQARSAQLGVCIAVAVMVVVGALLLQTTRHQYLQGAAYLDRHPAELTRALSE